MTGSKGVLNRHKKELEKVLNIMEPLPDVISDLLRQQQQHGWRRLTAAVDRTLRSWQFIEFELRSLVATLRQLEVLSPNVGPGFITDDGYNPWFGFVQPYLASAIPNKLDGTGRLARLHRAVARCLRRDAAGRSLFYTTGDSMQRITSILYSAVESPCRYAHLMAGDGERTSRACSSAAQPHAGAGASLVGIEGALRSKQLRWFMAAGQEAEEQRTLRVMAMVGQAGVGKTTLAMEVYRQLKQIEGGHCFQLCATAKVSRNPDIKELLKHILSQIEVKPDASNQTSQVTTLEEADHEMLAGKINQCLQQKSRTN